MPFWMSVWKIIFKIKLLKIEERICFIRVQYDDEPEDVLKLLGEDNLKLMAHLINNTYETGQ